jgi:hypothetical protein
MASFVSLAGKGEFKAVIKILLSATPNLSCGLGRQLDQVSTRGKSGFKPSFNLRNQHAHRSRKVSWDAAMRIDRKNVTALAPL